MPYGKRRYTRRTNAKKRTYSRYRKRATASAYRAIRIARSVSRKVAGEVCKWQVLPSDFTNGIPGEGTVFNYVSNNPLNTITSGTPWVMPLNWIYTASTCTAGTANIYVNGVKFDKPASGGTNPYPSVSYRNPIWYNTLESDNSNSYSIEGSGSGLQYRLAYLYIRGIFNASGSGEVNTDGAVRFVIVKDKQPQGGSATWFDPNVGNGISSRGVFSANLIDAQLNPKTTGRFKIIYDKTLRFTTINGYKPFKYFKKLNTIVRNTRNAVAPVQNGLQSATGSAQSNDAPPPVLKNAYYLMIFSDGPTFNYSTDSSTPSQGFHLMSRIGYYNN